MELGGLRKKKGCFGRELFNSVMWSLETESASRSSGGHQQHDKDVAKKTVYTRIVAANANDLACLPEGCHGCTHRGDCSEEVSCTRDIYVASVMRCRVL